MRPKIITHSDGRVNIQFKSPSHSKGYDFAELVDDSGNRSCNFSRRTLLVVQQWFVAMIRLGLADSNDLPRKY